MAWVAAKTVTLKFFNKVVEWLRTCLAFFHRQKLHLVSEVADFNARHGLAADPHWASRDAIMLQAAEAGFAPPFTPPAEFIYQQNGTNMTAQARPGMMHSHDDVKTQNVNNHGGSQARREFTRLWNARY